MAGKYAPLAKYLESILGSTLEVTLSFEQVIEILKVPLPAAAFKYLAWWSFEKKPKRPQKLAWQAKGWKVRKVDLANRQVCFLRFLNLVEPEVSNAPMPKVEKIPFPAGLSIPPRAVRDISLVLHNAFWKTVFIIPKGDPLVKGRLGLYYHPITGAAAEIQYQFVCYSWGSRSAVYYCGSIAQNYIRGGFKSNLQGRVHNYLQNHQVKSTGRINTNLMVFKKINETLPNEDVVLSIFTFDELTFAGCTYSFAQYCGKPDLVHLVEQTLIAYYRIQEQCQWNRT